MYSVLKICIVSVANSTFATIGAKPAVYCKKTESGTEKEADQREVCADVSADVCAAINMAGSLIKKLTIGRG